MFIYSNTVYWPYTDAHKQAKLFYIYYLIIHNGTKVQCHMLTRSCRVNQLLDFGMRKINVVSESKRIFSQHKQLANKICCLKLPSSFYEFAEITVDNTLSLCYTGSCNTVNVDRKSLRIMPHNRILS